MDEILSFVDSNFKYILITFNFITLIIILLVKRRNLLQKTHNILFLTAHPDDQSMFFRPTIFDTRNKYYTHLLCLSGGNTVRQQQLKAACNLLKIDKVSCLKNNQLIDTMQNQWPQNIIRQEVLKYINDNNIKAVFTFDNKGVSKHANHISINKALNKLKCQPPKQNPQNSIIKLYELQSVNIVRKYSGLLDAIVAILKQFSFIDLNLVNSWKIMKCHASQFVWFRKLWLIFSRYNYMNTYQRSFISIKEIKSQ